MNQFVSGESDAKGLSVILPYIAVDPAAVAIRRPEHLGTLGIWFGVARLGAAGHGMECGMARPGMARRGVARQGTWAGTSARTTNQHNTMETTHSKALMTYAGQLYDAYMHGCGGIDWLDKPLPSWADYVCNPNNKRRVEAWVDVARVAIKIETEVRDNAL